jgi:heme/copper-type cytochrome/quinol oxidase subunit 3
VVIGGTNTAVLLISSLLMAFAVRASKLDQRRMLTGLLLGTALLRVHDA